MGRLSLGMTAWLRSSVSLTLVGVMAAGTGIGAAEGPRASTAAATGALSVTTDPDNAAIYVDGHLAGQTPATLSSLSAGEHRVRIVKNGYLENSRMVTVASGQPARLTVKLTKSSETAATEVEQVSSTGGGGGGSKKWLWIGIAGGGAAAAIAAVALTKNSPPNPGTISGPANALQGVTVSFSSSGASDPDSDPLTFTWNFGDGGTATGQTATHAYTTAGSFSVTLQVSDGKHNVNTPALALTVKSLTGTWRGSLAGSGVTFNTVLTLTQSGTSITGSYTDQVTTSVFGAGVVSGSVAATGGITFTVTVPTFAPFTFTGTPSADVNTLNGAANGSGFVNSTWTLTRG